ncbi:hypothetical protein BC830DRAFT_113631 [Chytriomyces sp. MP71]|nr:hypothetical protein BC830DRAFT_113631 [Chytriomyces sp. MP71]
MTPVKATTPSSLLHGLSSVLPSQSIPAPQRILNSVLSCFLLSAQVWDYTLMVLCYQERISLLDPLTLYYFVDVNLMLVCTMWGFNAIQRGSRQGMHLFAVYWVARCLAALAIHFVSVALTLHGGMSVWHLPHILAIIVDPVGSYLMVTGILLERRISLVKEEVADALMEGQLL